MNLLERTRAALNRRKGRWPKIAEATGLSYPWLCKFGQGQIKSPGIVYVEILAAHLDTLAEPEDGDAVA